MVFAARPASTRSIMRRSRASAPRSFARCSSHRPPPVTPRSRFIVGRDTRESGEWIEQELARGIGSAGGEMTSGGIIPTPAVAYVAREMDFDAGIVISASHNPFEDNGIKVFSGRGEKFTEALEREIEAIVADASWTRRRRRRPTAGRSRGRRRGIHRARAAGVPGSASPRRHQDRDRHARNGATTTVAPRLFRELGFDVTVIGASPDGRNINLDCGSTHPEAARRRRSARSGCRLGVAFDGDGDRAIFVDAAGRVVDGDAVLLMCARQMQGAGPAEGQRAWWRRS